MADKWLRLRELEHPYIAFFMATMHYVVAKMWHPNKNSCIESMESICSNTDKISVLCFMTTVLVLLTSGIARAVVTISSCIVWWHLSTYFWFLNFDTLSEMQTEEEVIQPGVRFYTGKNAVILSILHTGTSIKAHLCKCQNDSCAWYALQPSCANTFDSWWFSEMEFQLD